jgi:hypothetical protein
MSEGARVAEVRRRKLIARENPPPHAGGYEERLRFDERIVMNSWVNNCCQLKVEIRR